jgi:oligoendopeptidase F
MLNPRRTILTLAALPLIMSATTATAKPDTRIRSEIPEQYRWDFSAIYAGWEAWEAGMKEFDAKMDEFSALKGTLANGPDAVLKAYRAFDDIGILQYRIYRYPQLQRDVDTRNQDVSGRFQRVLASFAKFNTATSWFSPELLTIPRETMEGWLKSTPALEPYAFTILDTYRQHEHVLDEKGEKLLSYYGRFNGTPTSVYQELSTSDIKFPEIKLSDGTAVTVTPANYGEILEKNRVQADRAAAFEAHLNTFAANGNTYAAIYNSILQRGWASAQARNYPNTLVAALDSNDVPASVVETLVETTRAGTAPLQRYMRLRKKLLGLESYHLYDNGVAIFDSKATYPYDDATKTVIESVAPLGADYTEKYLKFVSGGRIDVYENEGKRSGAYCAGVYGVGPYLLMNYNDTLDAIFTLAHEAGHAMHTVLSYESQPFVNASYTIFVAEVASTTNERFLLEHMLARTDDPKERFLLLQHAVDAVRGAPGRKGGRGRVELPVVRRCGGAEVL